MNQKPVTLASIITATIASLCCIGPLVAAVAGVGTFTAAWAFEAARPYFLALTGLLLASAFYLRFRSMRPAACSAGLCQPSSWLSRYGLWLVTVSVIVLAAFPYYSGFAWDLLGSKRTNSSLVAAVPFKTIKFEIEGMVCGGCAVVVQSALSQLPGVQRAAVTLEDRSAVVDFDPSRLSSNEIRRAVETAGFKPKL
jgi:copper chaperone CopZ